MLRGVPTRQLFLFHRDASRTVSKSKISSVIEGDLHVLAKATRVVVADSLRIAKALRDRVGLQYLLLNRTRSFGTAGHALARLCQKLQHHLHGLGFPRTTFARDANRLALLGGLELSVGVVGNGEHIGVPRRAGVTWKRR